MKYFNNPFHANHYVLIVIVLLAIVIYKVGEVLVYSVISVVNGIGLSSIA